MDGELARRATAPASAAHAVPWRRLFGFVALTFGMFMALLDIQIVASSLNEIQAGLSASPDEISWVQTAYLMAEVVMIPLSGFLSRALSTRIVFVVSAAGFTVMSCLCAFATNIETMIVFRALQGFIGGAMIPTVFAASILLFPAGRSAGIMAVTGLVATAAPTLGPTIGGWLTQAFSWHWLFLVNIVPGIAVVVAVLFLIDIDRPNLALFKGFDWLGLAAMAVFLGGLEYVLEEGPRWDWFADRGIAATAWISGASALLFFWRVLSYRHPIVDLRTFADRNFSFGCIFAFLLGAGLFGAVYIHPLFLARVRGYNSLQIGEIMFVTGAFQFASGPLAALLSRRLDLRAMLAIGFSLFALSFLLNDGLTSEAGFWELFWPQAVRGASTMLCFLPANMLALGTLPHDRLKNASGLFNLMRNLGGAIGLAAINTLLADRLALHWTRLVSHLDMANPAVQSYVDAVSARMALRLPGDGTQAAYRLIGNLVMREAYVMSFNDCLLLMAGAVAAGLLFMPFISKPRRLVAEAH